jgi:hypothetical protein
MPEGTRIRAAAGSMLREPTFHFLLLAGLFFVVNAIAGPRGRVLELDRRELMARILQIEASTGSPLTPDERRQLEEAYVDEQVLVTEAMALGLDRDARVHDLLAQKMLHVLSADVIQPDDMELRVFYEANRESYKPAPAVTVDEVVFDMDVLPSVIQDALAEGASPDRLARAVALVHRVLVEVTQGDLTQIMGVDLADRVFASEVGEWVGPLETVRGQHWYRLTSNREAEVLPFDDVRDQVRLDWIAREEAARLERRVAELRREYAIVWTGQEPSG